ncbi:spore coat protein JC [Desulfonispora thiosulfatigenes DSM 11270]|uniref:Spore coat protein JC n=1 Tax=Desulfonispora thiosulfatigenes DSM 11270 TaxID=656914 RepID=A0A1W1VGM4_DESTI|nr:manganese catalase family protein [Desulfonispora thiosulfatigenes]SMB92549.1 spore coat protein JC [Desulfonispora thiosulfatigenes DSM 11270]
MWIYEKKLQYPVRVETKDLKMAKFLIAQYGGPDGELSAALRYLSQRYTMPTGKSKALLTDIGTEELAHVEMIATMVYKLTRDATPAELKAAGLGADYTLHGNAIYPSDPNGVPWTAAYIQSTGDPITNLYENMAAEQKARTVYENLIKLTDDNGIKDTLRFLREREVVHFQRFGEALNDTYEWKETKKYH